MNSSLINSVALDENGKVLVSGSNDNNVYIWDLENQKIDKINHDDPVSSVSIK